MLVFTFYVSLTHCNLSNACIYALISKRLAQTRKKCSTTDNVWNEVYNTDISTFSGYCTRYTVYMSGLAVPGPGPGRCWWAGSAHLTVVVAM